MSVSLPRSRSKQMTAEATRASCSEHGRAESQGSELEEACRAMALESDPTVGPWLSLFTSPCLGFLSFRIRM